MDMDCHGTLSLKTVLQFVEMVWLGLINNVMTTILMMKMDVLLNAQSKPITFVMILSLQFVMLLYVWKLISSLLKNKVVMDSKSQSKFPQTLKVKLCKMSIFPTVESQS